MSKNGIHSGERPYYLFLFSAQTREGLIQKLTDLKAWIIEEENADVGDIAYTLSAGRSHFSERAALIAPNIADLAVGLERKMNELVSSNHSAAHGGNKKRGGKADQRRLDELAVQLGLEQDNSLEAFHRKLEDIAGLYIEGCDCDWNAIFRDRPYFKVPLPTYPFRKEKYWLELKAAKPQQQSVLESAGIATLGPVLDSNRSTVHEQFFEKTLTGKEFYLNDHIVSGRKLLPGVVQLEMAMSAAAASLPGVNIHSLSHVVWSNPIQLEEGIESQTVQVRLYPGEEASELSYEITSRTGEEMVIHSRGNVGFSSEPCAASRQTIDIDLLSRGKTKISGTQVYDKFRQHQLNLGPSFQSMTEMLAGEAEAVAFIELPPHLQGNFSEFTLHPTIVDGILEAVIGLVSATDTVEGTVGLPYSFDKMEIHGELPANCVSYVRKLDSTDGELAFDVLLADEQGRVLLKFSHFVLKVFYQGKQQSAEELCFRYEWREMELSGLSSIEGDIIIFTEQTHLYRKFAGEHAGKVYLVEPGTGYSQDGEGHYRINPMNRNDYTLLLDRLKQDGCKLETILYERKGDFGLTASSSQVAYQSQLFLAQALMEAQTNRHTRVIQVGLTEELVSPGLGAFSGFNRTISLENSKLYFSALYIEEERLGDLYRIVAAELDTGAAAEVHYRQGKRYVRTLVEADFPNLTAGSHSGVSAGLGELRQGGTYVITGGLGKLGWIVARHLAEKYAARLALIGRSAVSLEQERDLAALRALGVEVMYVRANLSKESETVSAITEIRAKYGAIHGIIHTAGVTRDAFIAAKQVESSTEVLGVKIDGLLHLDKATQSDKLDFIACFSSIAAVTGNSGQSDYAFANAFMDYYASYRNAMVHAGRRLGRTISINWPLWKEGGMSVDDQTLRFFKNTIGLKPLETVDGLAYFEAALRSGYEQLLILQGNRSKICYILNLQDQKAKDFASVELDEDLPFKVQETVSMLFGQLMKLGTTAIDPDQDLGEYGFNSITFTDAANAVNDTFKVRMTPAAFFEYPTVRALSGYLCTSYIEELTAYFGNDEIKALSGEDVVDKRPAKLVANDTLQAKRSWKSLNPVMAETRRREPIAIIGISGAMPGSKDLESFWEHLSKQKDLITEIPVNRWDYRELNRLLGGSKPVSNWGGFMEEADRFDPGFFNINPREADLMDPQQRIFLETVWSAIEDAGYKASALSGKKVGLFVGVSTNDYSTLLQDNEVEIEAYSSTGSSHCVLANRISYLFNFRGPSEPIDTACSSSLVAVHRAVESILSGDCDQAIAGGVNVIAAPTLHISFSRAGMLSPDGRCRTFDKSANGYVRGEGTGAILLKPLSQAEADGDYIYAVIKGTAINHGGKVSSLTVPNPKAQTEVLVEAYSKAGFSPDTVGYIEAHGTGTSLGDPVEINALKGAFKELYQKYGIPVEQEHYCGLGAVKTNIGHLEAAAGIAGILKVILAMKHKTLPGNVHFNTLNPFIELEHSPFYIMEHTQEWKSIGHAPRRAGVSSFGFGGVNAHVVLEDYESEFVPTQSDNANVIVLSARSKVQLQEQARRLVAYLDTYSAKKELTLHNIAYTLQNGREDMTERIAFVVSDRAELMRVLTEYVECPEKASVFYGHVAGSSTSRHTSSKVGKGTATSHDNVKSLETLMERWLIGEAVDWSGLYERREGRRIPLPAYPFARDICWARKDSRPITPKLAAAEAASVLHPMVDSNVSTMEEEKFCKTLRLEQFFLKDHIVGGKVLLPGVAYLEMVRAAAALAGIEPVTGLSEVRWIKAIELEDARKDIYITFELSAQLELVYQVFSEYEGSRMLHSIGKVLKETPAPAERIDPDRIKERSVSILEHHECYDHIFKGVGFDYGPAFKVTQRAYCSENEGLSELSLPEYLELDYSEYVLHPSLIDGAVRSISWVGNRTEDDLTLRVPYALDRMELLGSVPKKCYALARPSEGTTGTDDEGTRKYDIQIADMDGLVVVRLFGFSIKQFSQKSAGEQLQPDLTLYAPKWMEVALGKETALPQVILLFGTDPLAESLRGQAASVGMATGCCILVRSGDSFYEDANGDFTVEPAKEDDYLRLFAALSRRGLAISHVLHAWNVQEEANLGAVVHALSPQQAETEAVLDRGLYSLLYLLKATSAMKNKAKIRCLYAYGSVNSMHTAPLHEMAAGFARSLAADHPLFQLSLVEVSGKAAKHPAEFLLQELLPSHLANGTEIKADGMNRWVRKFVPLSPMSAAKESRFENGGVYVITGGTGALGMILATELAARYQARLVLAGRHDTDESVRSKLERLRILGAEVIYIRADVAVKDEAERLIIEAKAAFGAINGIIHCAGIGETAKAAESEKTNFSRILGPKVDGTMNLDLASSGEPLDLFVLYSSTSAQIGDMGAGSYAAANAYMDRYAEYRSRLKAENQRHGQTVSINWPMWKDGRYRLEVAQEQALAEYYGMLPLGSGDGFAILESALREGAAQVFVGYGDQLKIARAIGAAIEELQSPTVENVFEVGRELKEPTEEYLASLLAKTLGVSKDRISADSPLDAFGLDSIMILELNEALQQEFAALPNTLFYEFNTVEALAGYFMTHYSARLATMFDLEQPRKADKATHSSAAAKFVAAENNEFPTNGRFQPKAHVSLSQPATAANGLMDIAVIGMDGRFPMAGSISELWENLKDGRDCITEIPPDRWDYTQDYDVEKGKKGKIYTKYGGFIDDVDKFDPLFFQMTPRDAELTDPQERLFLECAYHAVEDAGYTRERLAHGKVGVFVGVMYGHYQLIGTEGYSSGNLVAPNSSFASIANRVSYLFNFQGPSMAVDTMCSSSLTAIHLACESIRSGESDAAIAGGVNVTIHRNKYVFLCSQRFASSEGKCRAFGEGGDGYVASEGVGAVLLKPLSRAIEDGDHIYGVIKGTAINSGGKTSGYTVPNPNAQAAAIADALRKSGVDPRTITSLEAHGTGTSLGDPIEIAGLTKAFGQYTSDKQFCSISSVKSNIGHLESAAGIASVAKVMLQMKHKMLVPSIHTDQLNSGIRFEDTPFYVQRTLGSWEKSPKLGLRRAGISSFGAGGSNVHLIAEEFVPLQTAVELDGKKLVVLSAKNGERLTEKVRDLSRFLSGPLDEEYTLSNIAFTLSVGREEMEERTAIVVQSLDELKVGLQTLLDGESTENIFRGNTSAAFENGASFIGNTPEDQAYIAALAGKNRLEQIARLWVLGTPLNWSLIYGGHKTRRVSLPLYPFAKERYWLDRSATQAPGSSAIVPATEPGISVLHPLLDSNVSTLREQKFRKRLSVDEFFLRDHIVNGQILLPGVAYIEMARAAGEIAAETPVTAVKDIAWLKPVVMDEDFKTLEIVLEPEGTSVRYEISDGEVGGTVHSRGVLEFDENDVAGEDRWFDIEAIKGRCLSRIGKQECYGRIFKHIGFDYGPSFQVTNEVLSGELETLARLSLDEEFRGSLHEFVLHPALLDGAVRSVAAGRDEEGRITHIPFSLGSTRIFAPIPSECYVYTRVKEQPGGDNQGLNIFDIAIIDLNGNELVRLEDFIVRPFGGKPEHQDQEELLYYTPVYERASLPNSMAAGLRNVLVFTGHESDILPEGKLPAGADACIWVIPGGNYRGYDGNSLVINPSHEEDYEKMLEELRINGFEPTHVLHRWTCTEVSPPAAELNVDRIDTVVESMLAYGAMSVVYLFKAYMKVYGQRALKLLFAYNGGEDSFTALHEMLGGFANSIVTLHHKFQIVTVSVEDSAWSDHNEALYKELFSAAGGGHSEIRYQSGERLVRRITPFSPGEAVDVEPMCFKEQGVYLIPGGAGALGMIFAKYLVRRFRARVVCTGRQPQSPRTEALMDELRALGGSGTYVQADVSNTADVAALMELITTQFGVLDGIIHCAGTGASLPVTESTSDTAHKVMSAKVQGLLNLDLLSRELDPSIVILFSSVSVELGDLGVGYYAMANSFMDRYARIRNTLAAEGLVNGRTLSINWPLWSGGGFEIPESESAFYSTYLGMKTIDEEMGIAAFETVIQSPAGSGCVIVAAGDPKKIGHAFKVDANKSAPVANLEDKEAIVDMLVRMQAGELSESEVEQWMGGIR